MTGRDWFEWHRAYDDDTSSLAGRLRAVQRHIVDALDGAAPGGIDVLSVCAGQGRDLIEVLADHRRAPDVRARLVELDPRNAEVAAAAASAAGLGGVDVVVGDASTTTAYAGLAPADLVLACGVFGHATDEDIRRMIRHLPMLCAAGATVVWTRGSRDPALRPAIRGWFADHGFEELDFTTGGNGWGVGANRLVAEPQPFRPDIRLFTFVDDLHASTGGRSPDG